MKQQEIKEINKIRRSRRSSIKSSRGMKREEVEEINKIRAASEFTDMFFYWAEANNFSSQDISDELGASRVVISNWRSKGVPRIHHYAIRAYIDKVARKDKRKTHVETTDWHNEPAIKPIEVRGDGQ
jgi:hypothetical protein